MFLFSINKIFEFWILFGAFSIDSIVMTHLVFSLEKVGSIFTFYPINSARLLFKKLVFPLETKPITKTVIILSSYISS